MIFACNWYQNDRQGKQNSISRPNLISYITKFGRKFKVSMSVSYYSTNRAYRSGDCTCKMHGNDGLDEQNSDTWPNLISHSIILAGRNLLTFTSGLFYTTVRRHLCCHWLVCQLHGWEVVVLLKDGRVVDHVDTLGKARDLDLCWILPKITLFLPFSFVESSFASFSFVSVDVTAIPRLIMWRRCSSYWRWWRYKASGEGPFWC